MTMSAQIQASQTYADFAGLNAMKKLATEDYERGLDEAAKQVEAVFLQMLLKSMQQATSVLKSDLFDSNDGEFYQEMYASQLGVTLGQTKSLGIADMIKQQLQYQHGRKNGKEVTSNG